MTTKTNLEWGKTADRQMSWYDAKEWCKAQGKNWRLPTIIELEQANSDKIAGFDKNFYWSSTEYSDTYARYYYFDGGFPGSGTKDYAGYVRCVRGW